VERLQSLRPQIEDTGWGCPGFGGGSGEGNTCLWCVKKKFLVTHSWARVQKAAMPASGAKHSSPICAVSTCLAGELSHTVSTTAPSLHSRSCPRIATCRPTPQKHVLARVQVMKMAPYTQAPLCTCAVSVDRRTFESKAGSGVRSSRGQASLFGGRLPVPACTPAAIAIAGNQIVCACSSSSSSGLSFWGGWNCSGRGCSCSLISPRISSIAGIRGLWLSLPMCNTWSTCAQQNKCIQANRIRQQSQRMSSADTKARQPLAGSTLGAVAASTPELQWGVDAAQASDSWQKGLGYHVCV